MVCDPHITRPFPILSSASLMDVDQPSPAAIARWSGLQKVLSRGSALAHPDFEPSVEVINLAGMLTVW